MSEQQEEILYFVKESIELENKQIQEVIIGQQYIVLVSFSGSIYIFEKGREQDENDDEDNFGQSNSSSQQANQLQKQLDEDDGRQPIKKRSLFLDFDHKLELPFAKTLILSDQLKEIKLLIVAKNGEICNLSISISSFKIVQFSQKTQKMEIPNKEEKLIKNAQIIEKSKLLITYAYQIYLIQNFQKGSFQSSLLFEIDEEIDQIDYYFHILCISTYKRYYALNISNLQSIKLGSKEKQGFFGITFFPRNQNEFVMAARPNGYMWKVETQQGEVQKTLQFKDEDNNKLNFGRLYAFNRYILSINGDNRLLIIDMNDKQLITKVYPNCSQLSFVYNHSSRTKEKQADQTLSHENSFYLYYMENGKNLVIERCSIKNIQRSFEASLSKNFVGQCAELFEKYEALQNIKNLKSILKANQQNPPSQRFQFSSSFKDSVKRIEEDQFGWVRVNEIDQQVFKVTLQKTGNGRSEIGGNQQSNVDKIIICDIESMQKRVNERNLQIRQVDPKQCVVAFSIMTNDFQQELEQQTTLQSQMKSRSIKIYNQSISQSKHDISHSNNKHSNICKIQQTKDFESNSKSIIPIIQNSRKYYKILDSKSKEMLQKSIREQRESNQSDYTTSKLREENFKKMQILNKFITKKINQYSITNLQKQLIDVLIQRNPDMTEFIRNNLQRHSVIFIINYLSRNFIKKFIIANNEYLISCYIEKELIYLIQIKSTRDILNDRSISVQINKLCILNTLSYFFGESISIYQNCFDLDFDEIPHLINTIQSR